jgi:RND family efflux transporter MFP subunit
MNYETRMDLGDSVDTLAADGVDGSGPAPERARQRRLWIVAGVVLIGLLIAGLLLAGGAEEQAFGVTDAETIPTITVVSPGATTLQGVINATGTLAARREMPVGVVGEGGRVLTVTVEPGDWVRAGQVLAVIDRSVQNQQASAQAAQIEVAQADANLAQANLDRATQLVERGFISQADIDRLTATRDAARARVAVARAQLAERQARNAQLNILAPAAGLVLTRNVEPGQVVSPGTGALFSIARDGEMELLAQVGENELAGIAMGATGSVIPSGSDRQFTCQVWQRSPVINEQTRQGTARCALSYDPALRPGGFATATLASGTVVAPRLPESAVMSDDQGSYVYIVNAEDKIERRNVELGMISNEGIAIAGGLSGSERVVLRAGGFLTVGESVRPVAAE